MYFINVAQVKTKISLMKKVVFIDTEISLKNSKIQDIGAVKTNGEKFHSNNIAQFDSFIYNSDFICGHNIIKHDVKYLANHISFSKYTFIDTLFLSPLLFPAKPYHALLKDDKLQTGELNNPVNDSIKTKDLFYDEVAKFHQLDEQLKRGQNIPHIYANSILSKNAKEAIDKINKSYRFNERQKQNAIRIIKKLFSSKSRKQSNTNEEAESRIDYISDHLGIVK